MCVPPATPYNRGVEVVGPDDSSRKRFDQKTNREEALAKGSWVDNHHI